MSKSIAFFDFDGTITFKDTLLEIIKYQKGTATLYGGLLRLLPWLLKMKLGLATNTLTKEKLLTLFFKNTSIDEFQKKCDNFTIEKLPHLIRPNALIKLKEFQEQDVPIVVVTASPENWVAGWCRQNNIACIATKLEIKNNRVTGKIEGKNCHGEEKVRRIKQEYNLTAYDQIFCYGDTIGDKPMLALATFAFYQPFREKL